jgi:hypothetical protein
MVAETVKALKALKESQNPKEIEKVILLELIERLSRDARYEFLLNFKQELLEVVSPAAVSKAKRRDFHFKNETILKVLENHPEIKYWIIKKAREEALKLLDYANILENSLRPE